MKSKIYAVMIMTGLLLSASSVFLNNIVYADDPWSDIVQRQKASEEKAMMIYQNKYQFANMDESKRNWSGLTSVSTDENSRGRNIDALAKLSLENALAQFDSVHVRQLYQLQSNYSGLVSTPTDTEGRDRNVMIADARSSVDAQANAYLSQLKSIQTSTYQGFEDSTPTDTTTYDRQALVEQKWSQMESDAANLVNKIAKINGDYIDLEQYTAGNPNFAYHVGSTTNENTSGRQYIQPANYAEQKAILIFEQIHQKHLAYLKSNYYGLSNSVSTDENGRDRNAMLAQAQATALENAMRVYNSYYPNSAGVHQ